MRKTKEYISDLQQKIIELHKLGSGLKKIYRAVKMPISTIRAMGSYDAISSFAFSLECHKLFMQKWDP